jgi:hypothetical protein
MKTVAATPISVRMSRILEAALVYANVSPPETTSTDPIKLSCQSIATASPQILLASRTRLYLRDALLVRTRSRSADLESSSHGKVGTVASWLRLSRREEARKTAEILILRHQLTVLQRRQPHCPALNWADRALLATLPGVIPRARRQRLRLLAHPGP